MSPLGRWALVNLVIAPTRARKVARAYRSIWTPEGSPLLVHGRGLAAGLARPGWRVGLGMQCGEPGLGAALDELGDVERLIVAPLYPQWADATTGSALEAVFRALAGRRHVPHVTTLRPFYAHPAYLDALAARIDTRDTDVVLLSFHGLPVSQVPCVGEACEAGASSEAWRCYRAHCFATARGVASRLAGARTVVAFQSRLGREEWLRPATEATLVDLAKSGARRVVVSCPSFVADCLETLEEIGIRAAEVFRAAGGESLRLAPGLNAGEDWVAAVGGMIEGVGG
jgi:ferrochelatase